MSDVISIKGRGKKKDENKLSQAQIYDVIKDVINEDPLTVSSNEIHGLLPAFPEKIAIIEPDDGERIPIVIDPKTEVCRMVNEAYVVNSILNYVKHELLDKPEFNLVHNQAIACYRTWLGASATRIVKPAQLLWADEPGLTWWRLPWPKPTKVGPMPTWDNLLGRLSNAAALKCWIGSLFDPAANHQQYVWVHGQGGDGKGALDRFLQKVFGRSYRSEEPPAPSDKFWTYFLIGAKLVSFADCNAQGFPASGRFKSLCANDAIRCEIKGGRAFTMRLNCRFIFYSNEKPSLSTEKADMRRVIFCAFEPRPVGELDDPSFEARLEAEGGDFLAECLGAYQMSNPNHGMIVAEMDKIHAWASTYEDDFEAILNSNFLICEGSYVTADRMVEMTKQQLKNPRLYSSFIAYLERVYGVVSDREYFDGRRTRLYRGLKEKTFKFP